MTMKFRTQKRSKKLSKNNMTKAVLVVAVAGVLYVAGGIIVTLGAGTAIGTAISSLCTTVATWLGTIFAFCLSVPIY